MAGDILLVANNWSKLFPDILIEILRYLSLKDRFCVSKVCKSWRGVVKNSRIIWDTLHVSTIPNSPEDEETDTKQGIDKKEYVSFICDHCDLVSRLTLHVSQTDSNCVKDAKRILQNLSIKKDRHLSHFKLTFASENPLFYSGKDFLKLLLQLFDCPEDAQHFISVDLSKFPVSLDSELVNVLVEHHNTHLVNIELQNNSLVCNISKACIRGLVRACKNLKSFSCHMSCVDGETLKIFSEVGRASIATLSFLCKREDKYSSDIDSEDWLSLCKACPNLRVKLYFDHTCPIFRVEEILKPMIPVSVLKLRLQATVTEMVFFIAHHYSKTLEVFDVTTTSSVELDTAILHLAISCVNLKELHVWCRLSKSVVDQIMSRCALEKHTLAFNTEYEN